MKLVNPYLNLPGNSEEAFNFYKSVFGGEFLALIRFKDMPSGGQLPPDAADGVMHVALRLGGSTMMATDSIESMGHKVTQGNNVSLSIEADSREEADRLFNGLAQGGSDLMPMKDQAWGSYWGALKDKYGICWMVNYAEKPLY